MTDLSTFNTSIESDDLSSFSSSPVEKSVKAEPSDRNVAAQGALLSNTEEKLVETFSAISDMPDSERLTALDNITSEVYARSVDLSRDLAAQMVLNPDLSTEETESLVQAMAGMTQEKPNSMDLMSEQVGLKDNADEDSVSEDIRLDTVEISNKVNERLREKQALLNGNLLSTSTDTLAVTADLFEMFIPLTDGLITEQMVIGMRNGSVSDSIQAFTLLGSAKADLRDYYLGLSSNEQVEFEQKLAKVLNETRGIVFTNDNDLAQKDLFMSIVDGNYYGDFDEVLDNVIGILDLVGLGFAAKTVKVPGITDKLSKIGRRKVRSGVQPSSPAKVVGEVNPDEARKLQAMAESDNTDEAAKVIHGSTREDAVVDSEAPQVQMDDGSVENKPYDLAKYVREFVHSGRIDLDEGELLSAQRKQADRLQRINGVTNRVELSTTPKFMDDGTTAYQNVYGPADSAYRTPQEGIDNVMFALRDYGIEESDITILQKVGDEYVPTTLKEYEGKRLLRETVLEDTFTPASKETLDKIREDFILSKKSELMADVSTRLTRGDRKNLLKEKQDLENKLSKVEETPEVLRVGKDISARRAKQEAQKLSKTLAAEERAIFLDRIALIDEKLKSSKLGQEAEADLTRLEQGIIPSRFQSELETLQKEAGTTTKTRRVLPEALRKENFKDDFLMRVDFQHDFDPMDVSWDKLQVKRNFFDRIPYFNRAKKGTSSIQRHIVDIHSMLDPRITLGANVAVDRTSAIETALIKNANQFVEPFKKLPKERQQALMEVIKNNNFAGKVASKTKLKADGFDADEIALLDAWKDSWDQLYHLENMDLIKSLRAGGYQQFVDKTNSTELIARRVGRPTANKVAKVYDSSTNTVRRITDSELSALYDQGGGLAQLRTTERVNGKDFDYVIVQNTENGNYLRDIQDSDRVLNYREGYYTVRYKDPHIIIKKVKDDEGNVIRTQAVKTAPNKADAELAVKNMNRGSDEANVEYGYRDNRDRSVGQMEDDNWQIQSTNGRTSQRLRGERLGTVDTDLTDNSLGATEGPAEALLNSVRSISRRTGMRDFIERYKQRFMNDYDDLMAIDKASGQKKFPRSADDFVVNESTSNKRIADARTNLEYINYLENGYRNALDDSWKALLNGIADGLGSIPSPTKLRELGEKGVKAEEKIAKGIKRSEEFVRATVDEIQSPTQWFKARAFDAYLALNPLRQLVVQGHQATLLTANFGNYVLSQRLAKDTMAIHMAMIAGDKLKNVKGLDKLLGMKAEDALALAEEYRKTGFDAAIDRNNLVENGLDSLVETGRLKGLKTAQSKVVGTARKVGFDAGERINIMSSWLAHRNRALEEGKDITSKRVRDEVMAKARNYTFNMNSAGDMPYNKNALNLVFQFMQVPHKAMLQMTNRALSRAERAKLAAYNAVVLPMPVGIGYSIIADWEIENEEARDFIANGLEGYLFNKAAQLAFDDDTRVDFSSLAAVDPNAPVDLIVGLLTTDAGEILSNAPALSLWAGYNPRAANILTETMKFVTEPENISLEESLALMNTFASFSSGYANLSKSYKELMVQEYDRRYNSSGGISDMEVTTPEMFAKSIGFGSLTEAYNRETKKHVYQASQEARNDVKELYLAQKQMGARRGVYVDNPEWSQYMLRGFWAAADFSLGMKEEYMRLMLRDARSGDDGVLNLMLNNMNLISEEQLREAAFGSNYQEEMDDILQIINEQKSLGE